VDDERSGGFEGLGPLKRLPVRLLVQREYQEFNRAGVAIRSKAPAEPMDEKKTAILAEIPRLRRYARALLRDRDAADDLVQDSLERALTRLDNWRTGENPRRWLFTIMHHLFVDQMRKVNRRGGNATLPAEAAENLATSVLQHDSFAMRDILDALDAISPERRAAIIMVAVEGFSYAEAANILGIPAGTLMSRIARGREDLRVLLDDVARRRTFRIVEK
jgi:RNA polymerase sigma-70 factor (ECF subfamily)